MTEQTVTDGGDAAHGALTAGVVDTVRLTAGPAAVSVLVHPGGTQPVWVSVDGSEPETSGARSRPVWPGNSATFAATSQGGSSDGSGVLRGLDGAIPVSGPGDASGAEVVVKLRCTAAAGYTVEAG